MKVLGLSIRACPSMHAGDGLRVFFDSRSEWMVFSSNSSYHSWGHPSDLHWTTDTPLFEEINDWLHEDRRKVAPRSKETIESIDLLQAHHYAIDPNRNGWLYQDYQPPSVQLPAHKIIATMPWMTDSLRAWWPWAGHTKCLLVGVDNNVVAVMALSLLGMRLASKRWCGVVGLRVVSWFES
jgi:hypothetical protein